MKHDNLLIEIHTEELPPKALRRLEKAFCLEMKTALEKERFTFDNIESFAAPRRLALLVHALSSTQPDITEEKRGPAFKTAFDQDANPTKACEGFAASCGIPANKLSEIKTDKGHWVSATVTTKGVPLSQALPSMIEKALKRLPTPKNMRWGDHSAEFVRPIHSIVLLYGKKVINATIMGLQTGNKTYGHRFMHKKQVILNNARDYKKELEKAYVLASFDERKKTIQDQIAKLEKKHGARAIVSEALLDEVTGLVEWPEALYCDFDESFLTVPEEALISAMEYHQKSFALKDSHEKLLPHFITVSNIQSKGERQVIEGNERVMRARLSDAAFFYEVDKKTCLTERLADLKPIIYQKQLGSLWEKVVRLEKLSEHIALALNLESNNATRSAKLAKADLTSDMVGEFPELQGIMGYYYALNDGENNTVATSIKEHYCPKFSGDAVPASDTACIVAMADKLDTLVGIFGIGQLPTGDKDPFALRRAALGLIRIITEKQYSLDTKRLLEKAISLYDGHLSHQGVLSDLLAFIQDRQRAYMLDQGITADVWASVAALGSTHLNDVCKRLDAVQNFKTLDAASALAAANKRVSNILSKQQGSLDGTPLNEALFEHDAEKTLAMLLKDKENEIDPLYQNKAYSDVLNNLSTLREPVDDFFDNVLVMAEDDKTRQNRLVLLNQLRRLFLKVADVALLQ